MYRFIARNRKRYSVERMCKVFKISSGSFYHWTNDPMGKVNRRNAPIKKQIRKLFCDFKGRYGSERMTVELNSQGTHISRPTVAKLMKKMNLKARRKRKFKLTTDSKHNYRIVSNKLNRNFHAGRKGEIWVSDITYIWTRSGWLYLTVILDLFDRKVVGWAISRSLATKATVLPAWYMATTNRPITRKLLFHSDRGVQYACDDFAQLLEQHPMVSRSMSRKGDCWDNAVAESFFKSVKAEEVYGKTYHNRNEAEIAIFEYIEGFYNRNRRHSALGNLTITEFEKLNNVA
ncbi:IS3 family transposase [Crocinitomix catalasitica]|nr:IS3 family transposase [Crocinitomix catalasitica]